MKWVKKDLFSLPVSLYVIIKNNKRMNEFLCASGRETGKFDGIFSLKVNQIMKDANIRLTDWLTVICLFVYQIEKNLFSFSDGKKLQILKIQNKF